MSSKKSLVINVGKYRMHIDPMKRGISSSLWGQGYREPCFMWILEKEAKGKLGIDLGANLGYATLYMCENLDKVVAIEPDKRMRKLLKRNIKENGIKEKVEVENFAISNKDSKEIIYLSKKHPNINTLCENKKLIKSKDLLEKKVITVRKIDSLQLLPDFIKMDIEGYEVEAISGAMNTLKSVKNCKLLIEVHPQYYDEKRNFARILEELFKIGFNVKYVVSAANECPTLFKDRGYSPFKVFKDEKRKRGIFKGVSKEDVIDFCAFRHKESDYDKISIKIARSILLIKSDKRETY
jgi:FkbM family methyltransferase